MDTPPPENRCRDWSGLAAAARAAPVPEVDVRESVLASLSVRRSACQEGPESLLASVAALFAGVWMRPAMALLLAFAAAVGYGGYRTSDLLSVLLDFSF